MLVRGSNLAATLSQYLIDRITTTNNIEVLFNAQVAGLEGDVALQQIEINNSLDGSIQQVSCQRLFVSIGGAPNTEWAKDTSIIRDLAGYLITGFNLLKEGCSPECWTFDPSSIDLEY